MGDMEKIKTLPPQGDGARPTATPGEGELRDRDGLDNREKEYHGNAAGESGGFMLTIAQLFSGPKTIRGPIIGVAISCVLFSIPMQTLDIYRALAWQFSIGALLRADAPAGVLKWLAATATPVIPFITGLVAWYGAQYLLRQSGEKARGSSMAQQAGTNRETMLGVMPAILVAAPLLAAATGWWRAGATLASRYSEDKWVDLAHRCYGVAILLVLAAILASIALRNVRLRAEVRRPLAYSDAIIGSVAAAFVALACALPFMPVAPFTNGLNGIIVFGVFSIALVVLLTFVTRLADRIGLPVLSLLLLWAILLSALDLNDNHKVAELHSGARGSTNASPAGRQDVTKAFLEWYDRRADKELFERAGKPYPVFLVGTQGGGMYAAAHSALYLTRLQDRCPAFAQHVFAVSGVSGGALGAALFNMATRQDKQLEDAGGCTQPGTDLGPHQGNGPGNALAPVDPRGPREHWAERQLYRDHLSYLLASALFPDFLQRFIPVPIMAFDRSRGFEKILSTTWMDRLGMDRLGMDRLGIDSRDRVNGKKANVGKANAGIKSVMNESFATSWSADGVSPMLLLNTTEVETGKRVVLTPGIARVGEVPTLRSKLGRDADIALKTAVGLSARFPLLTSAGWIADHEGRKIHLVDGGYYENSGVATLLDLYFGLRGLQQTAEDPSRETNINKAQPANPPGKRHRRFRFIILSLTTPPGPTAPGAARRREETIAKKAYGFGELLSPIWALLNTQMARGEDTVRLAQRVIELQKLGTSVVSRHQDVMATVNLDISGLPLGWTMSAPSFEAILHDIEQIVDGPASVLGSSDSIRNILSP